MRVPLGRREVAGVVWHGEPCDPAPAALREVTLVLDAQGRSAGHIFNLGHGISQHTPPESVSVLVDTVHEVSRRLRNAA